MVTVVKPLPFSFARKNRLLLAYNEKVTLSYYGEPNPVALLEVQRWLGFLPDLEQLDSDTFQARLEQCYGPEGGIKTEQLYDQLSANQLHKMASTLEAEDLLDLADDAPVIAFINGIFAEALRLNASDIHIESFETRLSIRLRVDGVLQELISPDIRLASLLVSRIKVLAKLDIAEKRVPQDGRTSVRIAGRPVDVRVSVLPTGYGERVVMRLLDTRSTRLDLAHLGMARQHLTPFSELLRQPNGIILVTGPTGSGKTTTLYAGLQLLNDKSRNILTIEDPIEYALEGVGQTQVNNRTGMTFSKGLRAILRQDPDVVLVGEIRDRETADIAVQASLTGHLVLSTLHTNDAVGAVTRLMDIGIEPFLIASALKGVLAQRLLRLLCMHCKRTYQASDEDVKLIAVLKDAPICEAVGCEHCGFTGYSGRVGIYELLLVTPALQQLIHKGDDSMLRQYASENCDLLYSQATGLVLNGSTSIAEVRRTVREA